MGRITDSEMLRIIEKTAGEKFAGVVPTSPAICPTCWLTESNIPERFPMIPLMIMLLSQSVICSRILCMSRLLPYANTPNSFAIRDRSMNSCEKRDSADAVVVRNAIDLSSCNLSGLSAGAILNCGSAPYFQHVHLPESAENSQLRRLPAPDYVTGSFRRPVGIFAPTAFA